MKSAKVFGWGILVLLIIVPTVLADEITFTVDQKDYYFKTGEQAVVIIHSDNDYGKDIAGLMKYTMTQRIVQSGFQMSRSNSQQTTMTVPDGKSDLPIGFGTSNDPTDIDVSMVFDYTDDKDMEVTLDKITVHFVSNDSQKQNKQNQQSSTSQEKQQQQNSNNMQQQMDQQMQQMMNQMQQQNQQTAQQKLQNNQLSQDSSALKKEMQQQLQQQQQMKQEMQKQLAQNEQFQKENQKLQQKGYNVTGGRLDPETNNTGDFEVNYQNKDGEQASIKGHMDNGNVSMQVDSPEERQKMMDKLKQDPRFQEMQKQLAGYNQTDMKFDSAENKTEIKLEYTNAKNQTATINAEIENETVEKVELEKDEKKSYWWVIPVILAIALLFFSRFRKKKEPMVSKEKHVKPFDYKKASKRLLEESQEAFNAKEYKEAYGKAGQATRIFLSYENGLRKEVTNDKLVKWLYQHKKPYKNLKECFDLCSLVEFAKYKPNKKDYDKILKFAKKVVENG